MPDRRYRRYDDQSSAADQRFESVVAQLQTLLPGLDMASVSPETLVQMAQVLLPLSQSNQSDFGPGTPNAGKGDRKFSSGRTGITCIHSEAASGESWAAKRQRLLQSTPFGRAAANKKR